jgi:hypothetical protein
MNRLPLAFLMWLLALMAGGLPAARPPAGPRLETSVVATDAVDAPSLFKPVRAERRQVAAPARPGPGRHAAPPADFACAGPDADLRPVTRAGRPSRPLAPLVRASGLGAPRFPTGPPPA